MGTKAAGAVLVTVCTIAYALMTVGAVGPAPNAGAASSKVKASFEFTTDNVNAGSPISASFQVSGVRPGSQLIFEREFGLQRTWKPVARFHLTTSHNSNLSLPSDPIGDYLYRLQVVTRGKVVDQTPNRSLFSYGNVSFATICSGASGGSGVNCGTNSVQLQNSIVYNYEDWTNTYSTAAPGSNELSFPRTSCRSGSLTIETGYADTTNPGEVSTVQIAQSASDPQLVNVPDTSQAILNFNLDGGPFVIDDWYTGGDGGIGFGADWVALYYSGTFSCYTLNGLR